METKISKISMLWHASANGIRYNYIEAVLVVTFAIMELMGAIWMPLLWLAFAAACVWVVLASTEDAQDEAHQLIMSNEVYISDFIVGAVLMMLLASLTVSYGLQFGVIFFVAVIQNLRYTVLSTHWLLEERRAKRKSERDKMP